MIKTALLLGFLLLLPIILALIPLCFKKETRERHKGAFENYGSVCVLGLWVWVPMFFSWITGSIIFDTKYFSNCSTATVHLEDEWEYNDIRTANTQPTEEEVVRSGQDGKITTCNDIFSGDETYKNEDQKAIAKKIIRTTYIYDPAKDFLEKHSQSIDEDYDEDDDDGYYYEDDYDDFAPLVSPYYRSGAVCNDGTTSSATGRGACSWHGGVNHWY